MVTLFSVPHLEYTHTDIYIYIYNLKLYIYNAEKRGRERERSIDLPSFFIVLGFWVQKSNYCQPSNRNLHWLTAARLQPRPCQRLLGLGPTIFRLHWPVQQEAPPGCNEMVRFSGQHAIVSKLESAKWQSESVIFLR